MYRRHLKCRANLALTAFLALLPLLGLAQSPAASTDTEIAEIIVYGRQPGPPMWKVSMDSHELWLFGLLTPLPKDMEWESDKVAAVLARSQEYLSIKMPEKNIPLNPIKLYRAFRMVTRLAKNPDGALLEDVIPADLHARFVSLESQYPVSNYKEIRPYFAADALHGNAVRANGLTNDPDVTKRIERLVRRNRNIKETTIQLGPEYLDFEFLQTAGYQYLSGISSAAELACFDISLQSIEIDLDGMKARANAWALGYVNDIRFYQEYPDYYGTCLEVFTGMGDIQLQILRANEEWLNAAEEALANNETTFALLTMDQLIKPNGLLEQLRARGYEIQEP
jgi:hypothetical protein